MEEYEACFAGSALHVLLDVRDVDRRCPLDLDLEVAHAGASTLGLPLLGHSDLCGRRLPRKSANALTSSSNICEAWPETIHEPPYPGISSAQCNACRRTKLDQVCSPCCLRTESMWHLVRALLSRQNRRRGSVDVFAPVESPLASRPPVVFGQLSNDQPACSQRESPNEQRRHRSVGLPTS